MDIPRHWRLREQRYRLEGSACDCGKLYFPPRELCPACRSRALTPRPLRGEGTLTSFTVVHQPPQGFEDQLPYAVGLVALDEGPTLTAMLTDVEPEALAIGMTVEMVVRRIGAEGEEGPLLYGYKFRPKEGL